MPAWTRSKHGDTATPSRHHTTEAAPPPQRTSFSTSFTPVVQSTHSQPNTAPPAACDSVTEGTMKEARCGPTDAEPCMVGDMKAAVRAGVDVRSASKSSGSPSACQLIKVRKGVSKVGAAWPMWMYGSASLSVQ